jgi:transcriptional regulator GlxA family with amidase domain
MLKQIVIVIPEGHVNISSITGMCEILGWADEYWRETGNRPVVDIQLAGFAMENRPELGQFSVQALPISDIKKPDLVIVPSLARDYEAVLQKNEKLVNWIAEQYKAGAEMASVCTGVFLLAATGMLNGKNCSTHWDAAADLKRLFPRVHVHTEVLTLSGNGIYTNGGGYSFLNLALFLVEKYFNRQTAIVCAKMFQIDINRSTQSPFIIFQAQKNHGDELVYRAQTYIEEHLREKISFTALASRLAVSRRNLDRRFVKATGNTPLEYLQRAKIEVAKNALEQGRQTVFEAMMEAGYSDDKAFRETFKKITGLSPLNYRAQYNARMQ